MAYGNYGNNYGGYYGNPYQMMYPQSGAMPDMLNQYKSPYQAQMPQQMAQMPQQMTQQMPQAPQMPQQGQVETRNGRIWVQGEEGAKAFIVAPGCTAELWDSENPTIYLKSADQSGVPSMRILDWTERTQALKTSKNEKKEPIIDTENFVTFDVLDQFVDDKIEKRFAELNRAKPATHETEETKATKVTKEAKK